MVPSWIIGAGFPIWLASTNAFRNAWKGVVPNYDIDFPANSDMWFSLIYLIPASLIFLSFARKSHEPRNQLVYTIGFVIALIILSTASFYVGVLLIPVVILLAVFTYHPKTSFDGLPSHRSPISDWVLLGVLGLLIIVGFNVAIHDAMHFLLPLHPYNFLLVYLYTAYVVLSLILYFRIPKAGDPSDRRSDPRQ